MQKKFNLLNTDLIWSISIIKIYFQILNDVFEDFSIFKLRCRFMERYLLQWVVELTLIILNSKYVYFLVSTQDIMHSTTAWKYYILKEKRNMYINMLSLCRFPSLNHRLCSHLFCHCWFEVFINRLLLSLVLFFFFQKRNIIVYYLLRIIYYVLFTNPSFDACYEGVYCAWHLFGLVL